MNHFHNRKDTLRGAIALGLVPGFIKTKSRLLGIDHVKPEGTNLTQNRSEKGRISYSFNDKRLIGTAPGPDLALQSL